MKKLLLIALFLLAPIVAEAKVTTTIGPEISYISYEEKGLVAGGKPVNVEIAGAMYGVRGMVEYLDRVYLALDGTYATGTVDYSGTGTIDDITDYRIETRALIGLPVAKAVVFTGYGYRYLNDDMEGRITSTGLFAYERESTYQYVPIGVKFNGFVGELDVLTVGEQESHLETIDQFAPHVVNKQNSGVALKVSYNFVHEIKGFTIQATPFLRWWKVQSSKEDDGFIEPRNTSLEVGGQIAVKF